MKLFAVVFAVLFISTPMALAKGDTVKITIEGPGLAGPIEITDPRVRQFNIWSDFMIDSPLWANGVSEAPVGFQHYKVSFYEETRSEPWLAYEAIHRESGGALTAAQKGYPPFI